MANLLNNIDISAYRSRTDRKGTTLTVWQELERIRTGHMAQLIGRLRDQGDQAAKDSLPAVTWGGTFNQRTHLVEASGVACLDFDKVEDPEGLRAELQGDPFTLAAFVSPSGRGLKALVRIPIVGSKERYLEHYLALLDRFKEYDPDPSTKDITRLCYTSWDPGIFVNTQAAVFTERQLIHERPQPRQVGEPVGKGEGMVVRRLFNWWKRKYSCSPGSRNNDLFILACSFSEFGVEQQTALSIVQEFSQEDFPPSEIETLVQSAYRKTVFASRSFKAKTAWT